MAQTKFTPHVFISAASDDLRSAREVVKNSLLTIGCHPVVQEHFEPDFRTVKQMIRGRLKGCHAMVHLVGRRYGGEPDPRSLPAGAARRSWTQMEYDLATELGLKIYLFVCDDAYPFDPQPIPEPPDEVALQETHRREILTGEQLYVEVRSPEELGRRISEMKLEAAELRRRVETGSNRLILALGVTVAILSAVFTFLFLLNRNDADLKKGQGEILSSVENMRQSFAGLSETGGILSNPRSPEQFYHNARLYELRGDYGNARRAYLEYFRFDLDFLDPHLRFLQFLKVQEGVEGARETYAAIREATEGSAPELASALLWNREERISRLGLFLQSHPEFGPAYYLFGLDYSPDRLGTQALADKKREKELLERFRGLDGEGKVAGWFLDKSLVAEWRERASERLARLEISEPGMENPVTVTWMSHNTGWNGNIQIAELASEIFWKKPWGEEFVSTGFSNARSITTGKLQPQPTIQLPLDTPEMVFEVKYINLNGEEMGPFQASFDPVRETLEQTKRMIGMTRTSWVMFRDYDGKTLLYFTHLLGHRGGLAGIRYGLDSDTPDRDLPFPGYDKPGYAPISSDLTIYIEVPATTKFATVQVTFKDGTESEVERFNR